MAFEWREAPVADFAVIGNPVSHSLSPKMHAAIYQALGLGLKYVAIRIDPGEVTQALDHLTVAGYRGVNVTVPHKKEVLDWPAEVDPFCAEVEAANTIDLLTKRCVNTDAPGFLETLEYLNLNSKSALVLGAGGSARALVAALAGKGWQIKLFNRTHSKAEELAERYGCEVVTEADPSGAALILNSTSSAFDGEGPPVKWDRAEQTAVAYDLMYSRDFTPFLRQAEACGLQTVDGLPLLVRQGALSFKWWTGLDAPLKAMEAAVKA